MSSIWLDEHCSLKSYSATTKGGKSMLRIEIDVRDHYSLGYLLRHLDEIEAEQKAAARKPRPAKGKAKSDQLALPSPPLQLPYFPGDE
ncbi:hypothetical protein IFT84_20370 [Rhizobium sp. CFBP 8762]|uniref:hypothetical protein n=1 Tax=Rhizobium sp. CFBP 8762 TaxID=2775279 RepID=UPI0017870F42|nr:hypothetical protein [Rhizobium sp. CFBP 8762]MBD8556870.1 hypothetical protein [Rhizobium sp. CFBP 8762]